MVNGVVLRNTKKVHLYSTRKSLIPKFTLRSSLKKCIEHTDCSMSKCQFRQYHDGMVKHWLSKAGETDIMNKRDYADIMHKQTGHSIDTANSV